MNVYANSIKCYNVLVLKLPARNMVSKLILREVSHQGNQFLGLNKVISETVKARFEIFFKN